MEFFNFPLEIRLQIYNSLLIYHDTIIFRACGGSLLPPLYLPQDHDLHPALLRLNKHIYNEASPSLYSHNRFQFPDILTPGPWTYSARIHPFLDQIGHHVALLRHICISFHVFQSLEEESACAHGRNLDLIGELCTGLATLELCLPADGVDVEPISEQNLDLLDARLKVMPSPVEVRVVFQVYSGGALADERVKLRERGWTVAVNVLPKKT
ncbi:hypothetical protein GLAREA_07218 [Glarea lozoyensis ATCC 20868]|uniref:Uncharacterized protein n=1 Tax=Glarea lozoyensis (strain ATCC 20868 / MF5171) TaxID=1116229 RepID=S3D913_GLAL2|nr:uncharacterized protein GLAREA_07218 [Glarea lozoyensis ATCC 20868]EPE34205.1 hypothetical protein GLAREA_07218 [Glarea lozoyensis ATCC 20868]